MSIELDGIVLPDDLWWEDETDWTPVGQSDTEYSVTGALMVDCGVKQAGRPISLVGSEDASWLKRSTVLALQALAAIPAKEMTLTFHARTFTVIFNHADGKPLEAKPIYPKSPPDDEDYYWLIIRLKEV